MCGRHKSYFNNENTKTTLLYQSYIFIRNENLHKLCVILLQKRSKISQCKITIKGSKITQLLRKIALSAIKIMHFVSKNA
jgi:hypothetical protein